MRCAVVGALFRCHFGIGAARSRVIVSTAATPPSDPRASKPQRSYSEQLELGHDATLSVSPIAFVRSPYKERFGTPRQATVTTQVLGGRAQPAQIVLADDIARESLRGLDGFDYCWVLSWMHLNRGYRHGGLVTPPRLRPGVPNTPAPKIGYFATRAPHRPNPIALSALRIDGVDEAAGVIHVRGIDLLDGTPILDIKPYVPYCDAFADAAAGWIGETIAEPNGPDEIRYWPPPQHLMAEGDAEVGPGK